MSLTLENILIFWPILNQFPKNQLSQIQSFMMISKNQNRCKAVVITNNHKVFGFYQDVSKVTKIVELGSGKNILQMCHSEKHVLALTKQGRVLLWNDEALCEQLRADKNTMESLLPTVIDFGSDASEPIAMIRCGLRHNLAVTKKTGKVYAWGNNKLGQCGNRNQTNQLIPIKVAKLEELVVVKVECGDYHSMALTDNGLVYSWGHNAFGQLGTGDYNYLIFKKSPVKVKTDIGDDCPKDIVCGSQHSLLLTEQGIVYGCGRNDGGQVGTGKIYCNQFGPRQNSNFYSKFVKVDIKDVRFKSIHAVADLSIAISKSGLCYIWGAFQGGKHLSPYNTNLYSIDYLYRAYSPDVRISCLIQIVNPISTLASTLCESFDDLNSCDLKFVLDGRTIHVRRLLLQTSSPYYQRMLSEDWLKSDSVEIDDYSYSVYYARLRYIYTGEFPEMDNLDETIELFDLANYQLDYGLRDLCIDRLSEMVSIENCCRLFILAINYNLDSLRHTIGKFIAANLIKVIKSDCFKSLTGDLCREVMLGLGAFL